MISQLRARWARLPRWARWSLAGYLAGFADGTGVHIRDLARGGIHAYAAFGPVPVQVFLVALVILDPLVLVLVGLARPAGVWLGCAVLVLDNPANWIANWPALRHDPLRLLAPAGLLPLTAFTVFVLVTAPLLLPVMRHPRHGR
ncbi:MAG: hypothetical protein ACLPKI_12810 [Streptosporangiaceae bacterium]